MLDGLPITDEVERQEIEMLVDQAGDLAKELDHATPERLEKLY